MNKITTFAVLAGALVAATPRAARAQDAAQAAPSDVVSLIQKDLKGTTSLSADEAAKFVRDVTLAADELTVLGWLANLEGEASHVGDLVGGAHTIVADQGALYEKVKALASAEKRVSSHASLGPQFEIPGPTTGPILFGKTVDGKGTWFQLEGYRAEMKLSALPDLLPHMWDYVLYKLTGKNQSRFGSSADTEAKPLVIGDLGSAAPTNTVVEAPAAPKSRGIFGRFLDGIRGIFSRGGAKAPAEASTASETVRTQGMTGLLRDRIGAATDHVDGVDTAER